MKKIAYCLYITCIVVLLFCIKLEVLSSDTVSIILMAIALGGGVFCFGTYSPLKSLHVETTQSLSKRNANRPFYIVPFLLLGIPIIVGLIVAYYMY